MTVNDVVLAIVAGAMRRFLTSCGELPERQLVAAVPVSLRGGQGTERANLLSVMLTGLATDVEDPVDRVAAIHRASNRSFHWVRSSTVWG